jgi:endonuclease/exonuclease/phosphatase family metal-dependent hydrolase
VGVLLLVAAFVAAAARVRSAPTWDATGQGSRAEWTWLAFGPALFLVGALSAVPARTSVAVGWQPEAIAVVLVLAHGAGLVSAIAAPRWGRRTGSIGAGGVVLGTIAAAGATGSLVLAGQVAIAVGVGLVVGASGDRPGPAGARRHGAAAASVLLVLGVLVLAYYGAYEVDWPLHNASVLIVAAAALGVVAVGTTLHPTPASASATLASTRSVASATAAVVVLAAVTGVAAGGRPDERTVDGEDWAVRIALANLRMGYDVDGRFAVAEMAEVLRAQRPDVVVLNEVDRGWLITGGHDVLALLASELELPYAFAPAADDIWGNALLSRHPLSEFRVERLPATGAAMPRSSFSAVLDLPQGQQLAVIGTQLTMAERLPGLRQRQARTVAARAASMRERGLPVVLAGGLNAEPDAAEVALFEPLLGSAVPAGTPTYPAPAPDQQTDHVLVSPDLEVDAVHVPDVTVSDHRPVFVTLRIAD